VVLNKRELFLAKWTSAVLAAVGLYALVGVYVDGAATIRKQREALQSDQNHAAEVMKHKTDLLTVWSQMHLETREFEAQSQAMRKVERWAPDSGALVEAYKQDKLTSHEQFTEIGFQVTCKGPMRAISRLIWSVETASIPLRIRSVTLHPTPEGTDDLTAELSLSTICQAQSRSGRTGRERGQR
jgi:hypothetical protein